MACKRHIFFGAWRIVNAYSTHRRHRAYFGFFIGFSSFFFGLILSLGETAPSGDRAQEKKTILGSWLQKELSTLFADGES